MAKSGSTRWGKSKAASSSLRSRGAAKRSASSRSAKRILGKSSVIAGSSGREAKIDWAKVDATTDADIVRQARQDGTQPPSERAWRKLIRENCVVAAPPAKVDVQSIRKKLQLSQAEFAARFGFTAAAVRQWEQGRRQPHGPARVLLTIIDREPNAVRRALETSSGD